MKDWKTQLETWEGTGTELVATLAAVAQSESWAGGAPTVRLIRHYTQLGVLDRPERRGKEAYYGYRQIVQYLAARWLLADGWMLVKIAEVTASRADADLLALLPGTPKNAAQQLIQRFRQPADDPVTTSQTQILQQRARLQQVLPSLGNVGGVVRRRERVQLDLTDYCQVLIDADRLSALSPQDAAQLGDALSAALTEATRSPQQAAKRAAKRKSRLSKKKGR